MDKSAVLDQQALAVYRAILFHREQDSATLGELLELETEEVESVLRRLADLSLLAPSRDSPGTLRAVNPRIGLKMLLRREQDELTWRQQRIEQERAALASLDAEYTATRQSGTSDHVEELHRLDDIRIRLEALAESCTQESLAFYPATGPAQCSIQTGRALNEQAFARGVRFRSIFPDSVAGDRVSRMQAQWVRENNGEVRTSPSLPMQLLVIDTSAAMVAGLPGQGGTSALVFTGRPVVLAMRALFEAYWEHASPADRLASRGDAPSETLTSQERMVLQLLATGLTDQATARALGIGVRTERRVVSELMKRLGASSRFEAGVQATRRQWI